MTRAQPEPGLQPAMTLGGRIRTIRTAWGWSQAQLSHFLHVDQASISAWEHDRVTPCGSALVALAALFRCGVEALETGREFMISEPPYTSPKAGRAESLRSISLPVNDPGHIKIVDMVDGTTAGKDLSQAIMDLAAALRVNRKAWVIIE